MSESEHFGGRSMAGSDLDWEAFCGFVQDLVQRRRYPRSPADSLGLPFGFPGGDPQSFGADDPPPNDPVLRAFLERQRQAGLQLAAESDILELQPLDNPAGPPHRYQARFHCTSALRQPDGHVVPAKAIFDVRIAFPPDYLRRVHPLRVVCCSGPSMWCIRIWPRPSPVWAIFRLAFPWLTCCTRCTRS